MKFYFSLKLCCWKGKEAKETMSNSYIYEFSGGHKINLLQLLYNPKSVKVETFCKMQLNKKI